MELGNGKDDHEMIATLLLYNESLESLDISHNQISKVRRMFANLLRNRMSNILSIDLSNNAMEIEDFTTLMKVIGEESSFGNLHFKLRLLMIHSNPMRDFDFKIKKYLDEYYKSNK